MTVTCTKCRIGKDESAFHRSFKTKNGLNAWCKSCRKHAKMLLFAHRPENARTHRSSADDRERMNDRYATDAEYRERVKARSRQWRQDNPELFKMKNRNARLKHEYGITEEDFQRMLLEQEGRCALCCKPATLVVDHCHVTGMVRGLLCRRCNVALGTLGDNIDGLLRAIAYLKRFNNRA